MEMVDEGASEKIELHKLISTHIGSCYLEYSLSLKDYFNFLFLQVLVVHCQTCWLKVWLLRREWKHVLILHFRKRSSEIDPKM